MPQLKVQDTNIYYEITGKADQPVILLLHGLGSSVRDWEFQIPALSQSYRVLAIDMRGHGRSDKPREQYSIAQFAHDVKAVLDCLAIAKLHVLGLSMGGMIAFQMAVDYPERLQSLCIVNSAPAVIPRNLNDKFMVFARFAVVRLLGMRKMAEIGAPNLFVDAEHEELRREFIERWAANDPKAYLNTLRAIVGWTVEDRIHQITVPTLILCSDQDYTSVALKEAYRVKMPNTRLQVLTNARHAVSNERPEAFNAAVLDFLASLKS